MVALCVCRAQAEFLVWSAKLDVQRPSSLVPGGIRTTICTANRRSGVTTHSMPPIESTSCATIEDGKFTLYSYIFVGQGRRGYAPVGNMHRVIASTES